jgi:hypothetical protein
MRNKKKQRQLNRERRLNTDREEVSDRALVVLLCLAGIVLVWSLATASLYL